MRSRVSVLQALFPCVGSTFELNLNFIVHYSSLHLPPLCSSLMLVVLGRNNPSLYTVNGRPLYVHLNGLAIVLLK